MFSPEHSSIQVDTDMRTGKVAWWINSTCNLCAGEAEVLCVKYCAYEALKIKD